jgi:hypothetical protein
VFSISASRKRRRPPSKASSTTRRKAVVTGAQVVVKNPALGIERTVSTDAEGFFRVTALPAGNLQHRRLGYRFRARELRAIDVTLNRTLRFRRGTGSRRVQEQVDVSAACS